jgi:hypothetical protein
MALARIQVSLPLDAVLQTRILLSEAQASIMTII